MTDWFYDREHPGKGIARAVALVLALLPLIGIALQFYY